jgi:hypothetical protein
MSLYLQRHVFACTVPDVVLLDLRTNRYLAIPEQQSEALAQLVPGWPRAHPTSQGAPNASVDKLVDDLLAQNILTTTPALGKDATPVSIAAPARTLVPQPQLVPTSSESTAHRARLYLPALVRAVAQAAAQLRLQKIERIVTHVAARRQRASNRHKPSGETPSVDDLIDNFYWLAPFVFSGQQKCLLHSLALLHFLARFHVYPRWVFGVRKAPFGAHCWVQEAQTLLNDTPDRVALFTPIMIV